MSELADITVVETTMPETNKEWMDLNRQLTDLFTAGEYLKADAVCREILAFTDENQSAEELALADALNNVAEVKRVMGNLADAETLHRRALEIREKEFDADHVDIAVSLNNLAAVLNAQM
jgi:hypothetical protein